MHEREIPVGGGDRFREAIEAWDARLDDAEALRAATLLEALARDARADADAWAWCARAYYYLADYHPSERGRRRLFETGAKHGKKALALAPEHVGALFWSACCLGSAAEALGPLRRASHAPEVAGYLKKILELEPGYYYLGLARFVGQALIRQPGIVTKLISVAMPSIGPASVQQMLRTSIAQHPPLVLNYQTLGQLAWIERRDRATVREMREAVEKLDLDAEPLLAPENHRDRPRALRILDELR